ncbi:MAG: shikimate kinase [Clostridiales bacterium]|nr:shikimate kinase [Clostridiales bacterium]
MKNIIMIGMPASGKSVTGVVLAKALKMKFIDADLIIQEKSGKVLQEIIEEDGIEAFKECEENVLCEIAAANAVIATGGSAVYYPAAMEHLKANGIVVYLEAELGTVKKRLRNIRTRGVAIGKNQTLDDLYYVRQPLYEKYADITVKTGEDPLETTVDSIINALKGANIC